MAITDEMIGKRLWQDAKAEAIRLAKLAGPGAEQVKYTPDDELLLWNTQAKGWTIEKELSLLSGVGPDGLPMLGNDGQPVKPKSREEVADLKYPHRQKLIESGERVLSKYAQAKYAADMARKADPTWAPTPPPGSVEPTMPAPAMSDPMTESDPFGGQDEA